MTQPTPTPLPPRRARSVLAVAGVLLLTAAATWALGRAGDRADAARHATLTEELRTELNRRLEGHEHGLRGLRAAFANGGLTREGFQRAVASFPPEEVYPAAVGLGYAARASGAGRAEALDALRADGHPDARLHGFGPAAGAGALPGAGVGAVPGAGGHGPVCMIVRHVVPEDANPGALGLDLCTEPRRRAAAERAAATGGSALTAPLTLRGHEGAGPGFLLFLADYEHPVGEPPRNPRERAQKLRGWMVAALRADTLFGGAEGYVNGELDFEVHDGGTPLHASAGAAGEPERPGGTLTAGLPAGGRGWRVVTRRGEAFASASSLAPAATAGGGALLAGLLALLLRSQHHTLGRAQRIAAGMTRDLRRAARTDRLTGLPNRQRLTERVDAVLNGGPAAGDGGNGGDAGDAGDAGGGLHAAVLFLDFNGFKAVNDRLGHEAGDDLLRQIANRLRANLRAAGGPAGPRALWRRRRRLQGPVVARLGGDEFVVLLDRMREPADAEAVAARLVAALAEPYAVAGEAVVSSASVGVARIDASHREAADVLREADAAMYEAKRDGREAADAEPGGGGGAYRVFDAAMREEHAERATLEGDLPHAAGRGQLRLQFQPIVRSEDGSVESLEALVRWEHPTLGRIAPDRFIPVAEQKGSIVPLGDWVLGEALRRFAAWRSEPGFPAGVSVAVNLSRRELADPGLAGRVEAALFRHGVPPGLLHLEVTEREVMQDVGGSLETLRALRASGVRIDLDDFGTGHSSLSCLHELPVDVLKLDRAFVRGLGEDPMHVEVLRGVVDLAGTLGLRVVAEGVETALQLAVTIDLGCDLVQGYNLSRPLDPELVAPFCREREPGAAPLRLAA